MSRLLTRNLTGAYRQFLSRSNGSSETGQQRQFEEKSSSRRERLRIAEIAIQFEKWRDDDNATWGGRLAACVVGALERSPFQPPRGVSSGAEAVAGVQNRGA